MDDGDDDNPGSIHKTCVFDSKLLMEPGDELPEQMCEDREHQGSKQGGNESDEAFPRLFVWAGFHHGLLLAALNRYRLFRPAPLGADYILESAHYNTPFSRGKKAILRKSPCGFSTLYRRFREKLEGYGKNSCQAARNVVGVRV